MEFIFKLYTLKCIDVFKTTCWSLDLCCPGHDGRSLVPRNLRGPRDGEWGFPPAHSDPGSAKSAGDHCCPPVESSDAAQGRDRVRACISNHHYVLVTHYCMCNFDPLEDAAIKGNIQKIALFIYYTNSFATQRKTWNAFDAFVTEWNVFSSVNDMSDAQDESRVVINNCF